MQGSRFVFLFSVLHHIIDLTGSACIMTGYLLSVDICLNSAVFHSKQQAELSLGCCTSHGVSLAVPGGGDDEGQPRAGG